MLVRIWILVLHRNNMIGDAAAADPNWQQAESRKNCLRIVGLVVLAVIVIITIYLLIRYASHHNHHHVIHQFVRHHLTGLKHQARSIGNHLFSR